MTTQKKLREILEHIWHKGFITDSEIIRITEIDNAISEIKSLIKGKLPFLTEIRNLIRKHQIDIGQHRYSDMDRKEIRECCNVDQNDLAIAFLTEIEQILKEL